MLFLFLLFVFASAPAFAAAPATCANEAGLASRTDVLGCESWESADWWNSGVNPSTRWWKDQGSTDNALDGRRFHHYRVTADDIALSQVVTTGCMVSSCLKVNLPSWSKGGGNIGVNWSIPGQGGCEHDQLGCTPQQEIYLRYYMKLAPNFDPENYAIGTGQPQGGGGKFPGLADATNGYQATPAVQCGNGGEGPNGLDCWSARSGFATPAYSQNGAQNAFTNTRNYLATTRFALYGYFYLPGEPGVGTRSTNMYWDDDGPTLGNSSSLVGACSDTYGFRCGIGDAGLVNNKWYLIEIHIKMNDVGVANGVYEGWLDGVLKFQKTNLVYRIAGHNNLGIRNFWLDILPGGTGVGMKEDTYVLVDQMAIATGSRVGPWEGTYSGNMVNLTPQPNTGEVGFTKNLLLENVLPNGGTCFLSIWGLGIPYGGDNSIWCSNLQQLTGSTVGVWTRLFPSDSSADVNTLGIRDNHVALYIPHARQLWISGGSYIWPPTKDGTDGGLIAGVLDLANCATSYSQDCLQQKIVSRWTAANTTANWNAAFTNGAGATAGKWFCNFPPCLATVKNLTFGHGGTYTDNASAWNPHIRIGMHGWGYSAANGEHSIVEENIDFKAGRSICNAGAATGSEAFISCGLSTNPKQLPLYSDPNNCSDIPTGSGTTPGIRLQAMNTLIPGPDRERAFYLIGTRADNCQGSPVISRDHWVYNARTQAWTQLSAPPVGAVCDTPLYMYHRERNSGILQCDDRIWEFRMDGGDRWANVTPAGGTGFSVYNASGACDYMSGVCTVLNGNQTGSGGGAANGLRGFTFNAAAILSDPQVGFLAPTSSASEGTTPALIPVTLTNPPAGTVTVNYAVTGGSATGGGVDYTLASGQLSFSGGTVTQNISLALVDDNLPEANETVQITLSSPTGGATLGIATHTFTITDNDAFWASSGVGAGAQAPGSDSNDCRSINTPCLTLDGVLAKYRALNGYSGANGVVNLRAGDYDSKGFKTAGGLVTVPSGTSWAAPFTIKAYDGDRTARIIREDRIGPITKTVAEMQSATCTSPISGETNLDCVGAPTQAECKARGGAAAGSYPSACWNGAPDSNFLYLRLNRSGGDFHGPQNMSEALIDWYGLSENAANNVKYVVFDGLIFDGRGVAVNIMRNTVSWAHTMWGQYLKFKNGAIRNSTGSCFAQPGVGGNDNGTADSSPYGNTYLGVSWEREALFNGSSYVNGPYHKNNWIFEGTLASPYIIEKCGIPFNTYVVPGQTGGLTARDHPNAAFLHGWYTSLGGNECYYCELRFAAGNGAGAEGDDNIIDKSYVHSNAISGHYVTGSNTLIQNSVFYNNGAAELHAYGCQQSVVKNNTFVAGPRSAIGIQANVNCYNNNLFENNIFVGYPVNDFFVNYSSTAWSGFPPNHLRNNLMYTSAGTIIQPYRNVGTVVTPTTTGNILNQNPLLMNVPTDFAIPSNSPAKDAAYNNGLAVDRLGNTRPFGAGIDIGAYEFCSGGGCAAAPTSATITVVSSGASNVSITWTGGAGCNLTSPQTTTFNITCPLGSSITFTAPSNSGGANFSSWTGCTTTSGLNCPVTNLTSGLTVTVTYGAAKSLTVSSTIAAAVPITVSPTDAGGAGNGTTSFVRSYATNTAVTLTAPGNVGNIYFNNWSGCDGTSGFGNVTCTVTMNIDRAVTANYGGSGCGVDKDNVTVGTRVTLCADTTVRDAANGNAVGTQTTGAAGVIVGGPTDAGGVMWSQTNFDAGPDGWTTRRNLIPVIGAARVPGVTLKSGEQRVIGSGKVLPVQ